MCDFPRQAATGRSFGSPASWSLEDSGEDSAVRHTDPRGENNCAERLLLALRLGHGFKSTGHVIYATSRCAVCACYSRSSAVFGTNLPLPQASVSAASPSRAFVLFCCEAFSDLSNRRQGKIKKKKRLLADLECGHLVAKVCASWDALN